MESFEGTSVSGFWRLSSRVINVFINCLSKLRDTFISWNKFYEGTYEVIVHLSDDEGGTIKPVSHGKKSSQNDLYMRLGLLLGDNARRSARAAQSPPRQPGSAANRSSHSHESCASFSSLASLEAHTLASTNTSPVSTLTGMFHCQDHNCNADYTFPGNDIL
jgi:hypothetical protein